MKNKHLIYLLGPLVLLIWGLIFYKVYEHFRGGKEVFGNAAAKYTDKKENAPDTFTIKANYRDPFLDRNYRLVTQSIGKTNISEHRSGIAPKTVVPEVFPDIRYYGLIANAKNKRKVGLFKMSNKDLLLKEGESFNDLKITKLFNDSAKITYHKTKKTIKNHSTKI